MSFQRFLAVSTFSLASAATSSAFAHAKLQSSDPRAGSTLDTAPKQVRLKFNETLEPAFSRIRITGPGNKAIAATAATVDKADPTVMTAPLPPLSTGEYHIQWTTMTRDGHKVKGEVAFKIK
jgi:methionine-rich copper-binding protein CopC